MKEYKLIQRLKKSDAKAQKYLYDTFAPQYMALCIRYLKDKSIAEDVLMKGFMKIFTQIKKFEKRTSLGAWMYRVFVNECLMEIRKTHNLNIRLENTYITPKEHTNALDGLYEEDLLQLVKGLPTGCRTVFNLYVIEGYTHKEISHKLNISEGTSKSQLNLAKTKLKRQIQQHQEINYGR